MSSVHTYPRGFQIDEFVEETEPLVGGRLGKVSPEVAIDKLLIGALLIVGVGATWTATEVGPPG